ncbi:MAG: hypothetical protein H6716_20640 [Polyangiaceae bacterium]|nr:hypothetical protein [Polyangiaceae bacterium]
MISDHYRLPRRLAQMRATCLGGYMDGFSTTLTSAGYSPFVVRGYLCRADHIGRWADRRRIEIQSWDEDVLVRFERHLPRCKCSMGKKAPSGDAHAGGQLLAYLRACEVVASAKPSQASSKDRPISVDFGDWLVRHRGVVPSTTARYQRMLRPFLAALGEDPSQYTVAAIRAYVIDQLGAVGRGETRSTVTALRAFLRFLVAQGRVHSGLQLCVPTVPEWRLSSLPRYIGNDPNSWTVFLRCQNHDTLLASLELSGA